MAVQKSGREYWILAICICLLVGFGCSRSSAPPPNPISQPQPPGSSMGSTPGGTPAPQTASGPRPQYLDFPDIPIPMELDVRSAESNVFESGALKMGFITLRGRVDTNSLITFFTTALPREGWKLKGQFRYSRSMLIFEKQNKTCVMLLKESTIYTYVEIYVVPMPT